MSRNMKRTLASTLLLALLWSMLCSVPKPAQAKSVKDSFLVRTESGSDRVMLSLIPGSLLPGSVTKLPESDFDALLVRTESGSDRVMLSLIPGSVTKLPESDFATVVKVVEEFYNVKHKSLPFLAKAGIKTARAAAHLAGGSKRRIAESGSVKLAFFEDQEFGAKGGVTNFRTALKAALVGRWLPFVQVLSLNDGTQTYVFLRDSGPKYTVMVVTIEEHDAVVVQVDLAPQTLAMLMQDPNEMGKAITDDATKNDDQE
jgi:hypothetical protein